MEEKEKVTKPRGWNKESVGKDDQHKPKKENPKKKKSQNLEKNEKSGKNPKLPTADGSRQSRLDKENAEKEVANKNVWAERMSKQKKEDTDNDVSRVFRNCIGVYSNVGPPYTDVRLYCYTFILARFCARCR